MPLISHFTIPYRQNTVCVEASLHKGKFAVSGFTGTHIIMKLSNLHITGFHGLLLHVGVLRLSNQTLLMILLEAIKPEFG